MSTTPTGRFPDQDTPSQAQLLTVAISTDDQRSTVSDYIDTRQLIQTQLVAIETDEDQVHRAFLTCWASSGKTRRVRLADISRSGSTPLS